MLEPYNPNKKVIVLVHGLASSPEAWIRLTNDIMGDSVLREHYQVWQVFYSTNMPIIESRFQIYSNIDIKPLTRLLLMRLQKKGCCLGRP